MVPVSRLWFLVAGSWSLVAGNWPLADHLKFVVTSDK
jgi:hypothetical protein